MSAFTRAVAAGRWVTFFIGTLSLFLLGASWAISSPLASGPDEPAHIIKAASVARGQLLGDPTEKPAVTRVRVPVGLAQANSWPCFAYQPTVDASCVPSAASGDQLAEADTSAGLYNPAYYALVGIPSLATTDPASAVFIMRLTGVLVASMLLAVTLCAMVRLGAPLLTGVGFLAGMTPMVFFLNGVVNPNSMEVAAGAATLSSLLVLLRGDSLHTRLWLVVATVSGILLAQSRALSPLWMAMIAVVLLIVSPRARIRALLKRWDGRLALAALFLGVVLASSWTLATGTLGRLGTFPGAGDVTAKRAFFTMLVDRSFDAGIIGVYGWLDTPSPAFAYVLWSCLGLGIVILGFLTGRGRLVAGLAVAVAGFLLAPPLVQAVSISSSGYIWQGRYGLVAYVVVVIIAGVTFASNRDVVRLTTRRTGQLRFQWVVAPLFVVGHAFSLVTAIKRYSVGLDGDWLDIIRNPSWVPPGGALTWVLTGAIGAVGILFVILAATAGQRGRGVHPSPGRPGSALEWGERRLGRARKNIQLERTDQHL